MASTHDDYIVSPETNNQDNISIPPFPLSNDDNIADHSSLSNHCPHAPQSPSSLHNLDLGYFSDYPLTTVDNHNELMEMCLKSNNPEAHYIEGLKDYFFFENTAKGLEHLRLSAEGQYENGIYMYGLLLMCRGNFNEGKRYMETLGWEDNKRPADRCWSRMKRSLRRFDITMKKRYIRNMLLLKPKKRCHVNDMDNRCKRCFYYKQVMKFIDFI